MEVFNGSNLKELCDLTVKHRDIVALSSTRILYILISLVIIFK